MTTFIAVIAVWLVSLALHEYAHARVALAGGDWTVREKGYLTLNPFKFMDPINSILWPVVMLLMGGIGLPGGAVWIRQDLLRSRGWRSAVSVAGPAANFVMLALLSAPFALRLNHSNPDSAIWPILAYSAMLQAMAFILNMLPLPGLDGYSALAPYLTPTVHATLWPLRQYMFFILLILFMQVQAFGRAFWNLVFHLTDLAQIPEFYVWIGQASFRFWEHA